VVVVVAVVVFDEQPGRDVNASIAASIIAASKNGKPFFVTCLFLLFYFPGFIV
jgi:hypothetical protein